MRTRSEKLIDRLLGETQVAVKRLLGEAYSVGDESDDIANPADYSEGGEVKTVYDKNGIQVVRIDSYDYDTLRRLLGPANSLAPANNSDYNLRSGREAFENYRPIYVLLDGGNPVFSASRFRYNGKTFDVRFINQRDQDITLDVKPIYLWIMHKLGMVPDRIKQQMDDALKTTGKSHPADRERRS